MHGSFYETMATIIPVMFLALSVQSSEFIRPSRVITKSSRFVPKMNLILLVGVLVALAFSEGIMLYGAYKTATHPNFEIPIKLTFLACYVVCASMLLITMDYIAQRHDLEFVNTITRTKRRLLITWIILIGTVVILGLFISKLL